MVLRQPRFSARRGFTLTELAIVLSIMGTILGAIWVAASHVQSANKIQKATGQVTQIVNNYRTLYAQHGVDVAGITDVTCIGANANYFPADIANSATCVTGAPATYPTNAWGGYVQVSINQTYNGIVVGYHGLTQAACDSLAVNLTQSPEIISENINGLTQDLPPFANNTPYTPLQIDGACRANSFIEFMYKAQ